MASTALLSTGLENAVPLDRKQRQHGVSQEARTDPALRHPSVHDGPETIVARRFGGCYRTGACGREQRGRVRPHGRAWRPGAVAAGASSHCPCGLHAALPTRGGGCRRGCLPHAVRARRCYFSLPKEAILSSRSAHPRMPAPTPSHSLWLTRLAQGRHCLALQSRASEKSLKWQLKRKGALLQCPTSFTSQ